jgi:ABC-type tungstate transport system substrate-binding protein
MNLPSFLWLWKIAAWSMGLSLTAYSILAISGFAIASRRRSEKPRPAWWGTAHFAIGWTLVTLVVGLLAIGIVGTLGHYGNLGHSIHGVLGAGVVALTLASAAIAMQIRGGKPWARALHIKLNVVLGGAFLWVLWTGWVVVQKYLPEA